MTMNELDPQTWIGRTETCDDRIDPGHVEKMALSLNEPVPAMGTDLPALWHWCLFVKGQPYDQLGNDGHPAKGGFLPVSGTLNRMWAGGRVRFVRPLRVGVRARRTSIIQAVSQKTGRTGKLLFVTVLHDYVQDAQSCIREEQDIVYREPGPPRLSGSEVAPAATWSETVVPTSTMLFRYSAVTFNGHRIHYDEPYATHVEGYPGLVVHGPMIATMMCGAFRHANPDRTAVSLSYRGLRPLIAPRPFHVGGALLGPGRARLWAEQDGTLAHQAELEFAI